MRHAHLACRSHGPFFCRALPSPRTAIISLCGALGLWLGMANPVLHLPPLALLYPAALLLLGQTAPDAPSALRRGWLCGLVGASACLYWIAVPVHDFGALPWVLAAPCALALGAYVGLYGGLFSLLARTTRDWPFWQRTASWGLSWFLLEWVRGMLLTGFPWVPLAAAFAPWPAWIQGAAFVGAYGLGGVLAMLACMVAEGAAAAIPSPPASAPRAPLRYRLRRAAIPLCAMGLLVAAGHWRVADITASLPALPTLRVALVQGNVDQNQKWSTQYQQQTVHLYAELSRQAPEAELLIWPETAMPFAYPEHALSTAVQAFAAQQAAWVLFGAPGVVRNGKEHTLFNRAYLLRPDGQNSARYEKEHLVPFGEYMPPWLDIPFLRPLLQGIGDFTPGRQVAPLILHPQAAAAVRTTAPPPLALGMLICYESIFPELSQARVADAATLLINISNDAWFGRTAAPEQHLQLSVLRAVEQGRTLVRGTNTGISAVVDPTGRIRARSALFVTTVLEAAVPLRRDHTVLHRLFYFLAPAAGLALGGLFVTARLRTRRKTARPI